MAIVDQIWKKKLNEDSCVKKNSIHKLLWFLLQTFRTFFWVVESKDILPQIVHWFWGETLAHQVDHGKVLHDLRLSIRAHRSRSMPRCPCPKQKRCRCDPVTLHQWPSEAVWNDATLHVLVAPLALYQTMFHSWWRIMTDRFVKICEI